MTKSWVRLLAILLASTAVVACASDDPHCEKIVLESGLTVSISKMAVLAPIDGGRGPYGPALGVLLKPELIEEPGSHLLRRLTLWHDKESAAYSNAKCEESKLMKEDVIVCRVPIDGAGLTLMAQFEPRKIDNDDLTSYSSATNHMASKVQRYLSCVPSTN